MKNLAYFSIRFGFEIIVVTLLSTVLSPILSVLLQGSTITEENKALLLVLATLVIVSIAGSLALLKQLLDFDSRVKNMDKVIEDIKNMPNARYFHQPDERSLLFDMLKIYTHQAKDILVVNYFSGNETSESGPADQKLQTSRKKYYQSLLDIGPGTHYTRIIQIDERDKPLNAVIKNKAYMTHFFALHKKNTSRHKILITDRHIPTTYTLIDKKYLLIQVEKPKQVNGHIVIEMWGIITIENPPDELVRQFRSITEAGTGVVLRSPSDKDFA